MNGGARGWELPGSATACNDSGNGKKAEERKKYRQEGLGGIRKVAGSESRR